MSINILSECYEHALLHQLLSLPVLQNILAVSTHCPYYYICGSHSVVVSTFLLTAQKHFIQLSLSIIKVLVGGLAAAMTRDAMLKQIT